MGFTMNYPYCDSRLGISSLKAAPSRRLLENQLDSPSVVAMPACLVAWVNKDIPSPYP